MASKSKGQKCSWCLHHHVPPWGNFCQALLETQRHSQAIARKRSTDSDNNTVILPMSLLTHRVQTLHRENERLEQGNSGSSQPAAKLAQIEKVVLSQLLPAPMGDSHTISLQESPNDVALLGGFENPKVGSSTLQDYELRLTSPQALAFLRKLEAMEATSETKDPSDKEKNEGVPEMAMMRKLRPMKMKQKETFDGLKRLRSASLPLVEFHKAIGVNNQQHISVRQIEGMESNKDVLQDHDMTPESPNKYQRPRELKRARKVDGLWSNELSVWRGGGVYNDTFELEELDTNDYNDECSNPDLQAPHGDIIKDKVHCNNCQTYFNPVGLNDNDDAFSATAEALDTQQSSTDKTHCPNCQIVITPADLEDNYQFDYTNPEASMTSSMNHSWDIYENSAAEKATLEAHRKLSRANSHPNSSPSSSPSIRRRAPRRYSMGDMALEQYMRGEVLMHHGELLFATMETLTEDQGLYQDRDTLELGYPGPGDKGLLKRQSNGGTHLDEVDVLTHKPPGMMEAEVPATRRDQPVRVELSVVYLKIGEIDTLKEHYEADVLIKAKWKEPLLDKAKIGEVPSSVDWASYWNPKLFIENTIGEPRETAFHMYVHNAKGEAFIIEKRRVKGVFLENLELKDFPFDVQDLTVTVMSERSCLEIEIAEDPDDMHKVNKQSFIDEQEWHLYKCVETEIKEVTNEYSDPSIKRSALSVKCRAARRPAYFFWNIFLITFLICSLAFATFSVERGLPQNRLQLSFTLVLTSVAFKFVVNQSLPKISYLTYLDKYVLVAMILLTAVCAWHGLTSAIALPDKEGKLLELVALIVFMGGYFLFNLIFVIRIYMRPGRKRRIMKFKEREYMEKMNVQMTRQKAMTLKQVADSPYITVI